LNKSKKTIIQLKIVSIKDMRNIFNVRKKSAPILLKKAFGSPSKLSDSFQKIAPEINPRATSNFEENIRKILLTWTNRAFHLAGILKE